jgi:hypothetical protein
MPAFRTSACGMYFVNRYRASIGRSVIGGALPSATNGSARPTNGSARPTNGSARPTNGSAELAGNVTEGNVTEGNVTEGNVTEGNVTGGNATPRPTS